MSDLPEFKPFPKIPRLRRTVVVTEGRRAMHDEMLLALARMANEFGGSAWGRALWAAHERLRTEVKP